MPEKEQKRLKTKSKTKKDRDMRFSPFERAAEFGSRGLPVVDYGLYTGTMRDALGERSRAPGKDASRGVPV